MTRRGRSCDHDKKKCSLSAIRLRLEKVLGLKPLSSSPLSLSPMLLLQICTVSWRERHRENRIGGCPTAQSTFLMNLRFTDFFTQTKYRPHCSIHDLVELTKYAKFHKLRIHCKLVGKHGRPNLLILQKLLARGSLWCSVYISGKLLL